MDHTAEIELEIEAGSEPEVLAEAMRALAELLGSEGSERSEGGERSEDGEGSEGGEGSETRRSVAVEASDRPALLAAWIEELAFLAESEGFVGTRVLELDLGSAGLNATVAGVVDDPPPLVKAVTYHRLAFEPCGPGYVARVVLDV